MSKYDRTIHPTHGLKPLKELWLGAMVMDRSVTVFASICDGTFLNGVILKPEEAEEAARCLIEAARVARANQVASNLGLTTGIDVVSDPVG